MVSKAFPMYLLIPQVRMLMISDMKLRKRVCLMSKITYEIMTIYLRTKCFRDCFEHCAYFSRKRCVMTHSHYFYFVRICHTWLLRPYLYLIEVLREGFYIESYFIETLLKLSRNKSKAVFLWLKYILSFPQIIIMKKFFRKQLLLFKLLMHMVLFIIQCRFLHYWRSLMSLFSNARNLMNFCHCKLLYIL